MIKRIDHLIVANQPAHIFCLVFCFFCMKMNAQLRTGITNKPDTSYTNYSAYNYEKPYHPNIKLVTEFKYDNIDIKKNITYCSIGNRKLVIDAFIPKQSSSKKIAVIMIHGGGWRSGNRTQHYPLAESLAHLGYICFTPEYRLSTEALFPAGVYDIKAAIRWVKANASNLQYRYFKNRDCWFFCRRRTCRIHGNNS